jgi:hypothetical protein
MVRDWLRYLISYSPSLQSEMRRYLEDGQILDGFSTDELWHILIYTITIISKFYCVVDALDEVDIYKLSFLNHLVELGKQKHSTVKILMTCQPIPRI